MRDKPLFITSIIFFILYFFVIIAVFSPLKKLFSPFITMLGLIYMLMPCVNFLKKLKIKPVWATLIVYATLIVAFLFLAMYAIPKIASAVYDVWNIINKYTSGIDEKIFNENILKNNVKNVYDTMLSAVKMFLNMLVGFAAAFYVLSDTERVKKSVAEFIPVALKPSIKVLMDDVKVSLDSFFKGQLIIAFLLFLIDGIFLYVVGIPYSWGLAFIAGVLDIIPYVGATVAFAIVLLITLTSRPSKLILVFIGLLIIQQIENNIITPKISSDTLSLHPSVTVLSLYVGSFGGFWGILLAIPFACVFRKIFVRFIQSLL